VLAGYQTADAVRCVDVFLRPDGTFGFEEYRRDPEDMGTWTSVHHFSGARYASRGAAADAARRAVPWAAALIDERG